MTAGSFLEDIILAEGLVVLNEPSASYICMYRCRTGVSDIDVILGNGRFENGFNTSWQGLDGAGMSYHQPILMCVEGAQAFESEAQLHRNPRWSSRRAN